MNILNRSSLKSRSSLPYFEIPGLADLSWLRHAFLTRRGGTSSPPYDSLNLSDHHGDRKEDVSKNRNLVAATFSLEPGRLVSLGQVHQDKILLFREPLPAVFSFTGYDAAITNSPNTFLSILTADCLPIFVVDTRKKVVAAVHAGRQGTGLQIVRKVLKRMEEVFRCSLRNLFISLGPSIGSCCYEVDDRVFLREWEPFSTSSGDGKWRVNLAGINLFQLKEEGIEEDQIFTVDLCTGCNKDLFFSYRKEGRTGRQVSFIGILE